MPADFDIQTIRKKVVPFVLSLSTNGAMHFPILDTVKNVRMKSALINLQPGENVGLHNTGEQEEILIVLDGTGEVHAEGLGKQQVKKDSIIYIPPNNQHDVKNLGSGPLRYIYIVSPI